MDRARRAEPYSSATTWTREVARNLAGHLARISNAHSCVDTRSPKSTQLPKFQPSRGSKRCATSPVKTRKALVEPLETRNGGQDGSSSTGRGEEDCGVDNQDEQKDSEPSDQRLEAHTHLHQRKTRHQLGHVKVVAPLKHPVDVVLLPESDHDEVLHETRKTLDKVRVPGRLKAEGVQSDSTYDCPPTMSNGKLRPGMDYKQKQAQLKIWQENQAMAKRLRSTKPTLKSKDWERDDKWNQDFLKSQERRRSLLQTELIKAQTVPHTTIVRVCPLKLPHSEAASTDELPEDGKTLDRCTTSAVDGSEPGSLSARETRRRRSRSRTLEDKLVSDAETQHLRSSAANHRRIMQLRQQKGLQPVEKERGGKESANDSTVDLNDDELVDVCFTFLRRRSRKASRGQDGGDKSTDNASESVGAAQSATEQHDGETNAFDGALSPGVELEEALLGLDGEGTVPAQGTTDAGGPTHPRVSSSVDVGVPELTESRGDEPEASKTDDDPLFLATNALLPMKDTSGCSRLDATDAGDNWVAEEASADSISDVGGTADDNGEVEALTQSDAQEVGSVDSVDIVHSSPSDATVHLCDVSVDPVDHRAEEPVVSTGEGDREVGSIASDRTASGATDQQLDDNNAGAVVTLAVEGGEEVPRMDENAGRAPPELQQAGEFSFAIDASLANAEPEYQDDASENDDYQCDDDQIGGNSEVERPPGAPDACVAATEDLQGAPVDAEDDNEYGSEYEDDAEPDPDEGEQTEAAEMDVAATEHEEACQRMHEEHEHDNEQDNEQDEYSDDEFAD